METKKYRLLFSDSFTASSCSPQLLNGGVPPRTFFCICIHALGDLIQNYSFKYNNIPLTLEQHRFEFCRSTYTWIFFQ